MRSDGAINIYMVRTVEDSNHKFDERNGIQCSWSYDSVVVGRSAIWGTILHEIGHVFSLTHSDENDWSDEVGGDKNIMNSYSRTRRSLTEGQVFRMNFSQDSGLNHGLSQVPSASLPDHRRPRDCRVDHPDPPCPEEQLMLWSDR
jgi:hypothetical protein